MAYLDSTGLNTFWAKIKSWVGSQGYLTEHQDISGKVDKSTGNINLNTSAASSTDDGKLYAAITALGWTDVIE